MRKLLVSAICLFSTTSLLAQDLATCEVTFNNKITDSFQISVEKNAKIVRTIHEQYSSDYWVLAAHILDKGDNNTTAGIGIYHFFEGIANPPVLGICQREPQHESCVNPSLPRVRTTIPYKADLEISKKLKFSYGDSAKSALLIGSVEFIPFQGANNEVSFTLTPHPEMDTGFDSFAKLRCKLN